MNVGNTVIISKSSLDDLVREYQACIPFFLGCVDDCLSVGGVPVQIKHGISATEVMGTVLASSEYSYDELVVRGSLSACFTPTRWVSSARSLLELEMGEYA